MSTKSVSVLSCAVVAALTLSASVAMAASHGGSGGGGRSSSGGFHGSAPSARTGPGFARPGSRFGPGMSRNFRGNRFRHGHFDNDDFFFFGFGDPFFYPFGYGYYPYGYYPYGYYPPYGGYPYGYGYGGGVYGAGYETSVSAVVNIQRRLARAGYYHGRIDGVMGPRTRSAMRAYDRSRNRRVS